jgi:retron-type reverse transcriptase
VEEGSTRIIVDRSPHDDLLKSVARRVADGSVLRLIKLWLKAPIEERDGDGKRRIVGGKKKKRGTQHLYEPVPEALASKRM